MKVIVMRGIQGSGKSHFVANVLARHKHFVGSVSADKFPGLYRADKSFNFSLLSSAHAWCMQRYLAALQNLTEPDTNVLVVDNTNISAAEYSPYMLVAAVLGAQAAVYTVQCEPLVAAKRNQHGVPERVVFMKYEQLLAEKVPPWYTSFDNEVDVLKWLEGGDPGGDARS